MTTSSLLRAAAFLAALSVSAAAPAPAQAPGQSLPRLRLVPAFPKLRFSRPVFLTHAHPSQCRLFVVEQTRARILAFDENPGASVADVFLDLSDHVDATGQEEGLLALAFHPEYPDNRRLFVYYTAANPPRGVLAEYRELPDGGIADPASVRILLEVPRPSANHNGASLLFGPDAMLFLSLGDGGLLPGMSASAQDRGSLLGKILRINVDAMSGGLGYAVPPDNPFVATAGSRGEIWAYGLRNPWRMSFDPATGELWAGDVGHDHWEEVNVIVKGGNYGWNLREGRHPYGAQAGARRPDFIEPVAEYSHELGGCVVGGHVYRGNRIPALRGAYLFADYITGRIWGLRRQGHDSRMRELLRQDENLASFGEGTDGELYLCAFDGRIYRLELAPPTRPR